MSSTTDSTRTRPTERLADPTLRRETCITSARQPPILWEPGVVCREVETSIDSLPARGGGHRNRDGHKLVLDPAVAPDGGRDVDYTGLCTCGLILIRVACWFVCWKSLLSFQRRSSSMSPDHCLLDLSFFLILHPSSIPLRSVMHPLVSDHPLPPVPSLTRTTALPRHPQHHALDPRAPH